MSSARESGRGLKQTQVPMRLEITETWRVFLQTAPLSGLSTFVFVSVIESRSDSTTYSKKTRHIPRKSVVKPPGHCPAIHGKTRPDGHAVKRNRGFTERE